jgi:hypothetical protein
MSDERCYLIILPDLPEASRRFVHYIPQPRRSAVGWTCIRPLGVIDFAEWKCWMGPSNMACLIALGFLISSARSCWKAQILQAQAIQWEGPLEPLLRILASDCETRQ